MTNQQNPATRQADDQRPSVVMDVPLLLEQLQGQIDDLLATVQAQQATIDRYGARIAALERR